MLDYFCMSKLFITMSETPNTRKWRPLEKMFNEVPAKYDLLNRIITLGMDIRWRKSVSRECLKENPERVLDLCTGTGDLAIQLVKDSKNSIDFQALDYSGPMLDVAQKKAKKKNISSIEFIQGDAGNLPYETNSMDAVGITFAFRNLTYKNPGRDKYLAEIIRVLKPGGKFVFAESSQPESKFFRFFFRIYLKVFVHWIGGAISGHKSAYRYLAISARNYYNAEDLSDLLLKAGYRTVHHKAFFGGVARMTVAVL